VSETLVHVADRAVTWPETADRLKHRLDLIRWIVFGLSIAGAPAGAIASQLSSGGSTTSIHSVFAAIGTVFLATGTFVSSRFLRDNDLRAWVRARAAAEALKREAFKYAVRAKPYDDAVRADQSLIAEREKIENNVEDLADRAVIPTRPGSSPRHLLTKQQYREQRIENQINAFYRPKADRYRNIASRLRAVLTTVSGTIADIEASRYQYLVTSYLATARRLEDAAADSAQLAADPSSWSDFVNRCQDIIATENTSWLAKWAH
jgi:SMODS and SLOG-associating 2TM effector domain 3/SMODS and SLOG-associating 2TM effector domain 1